MNETSQIPFVKGLDLSELFFHQAVKPILMARYPSLDYSAARLDYGSDVLGFDTPQSRDHEWGPRLTLFLSETDYPTYHDQINQLLRHELPPEIQNYPTHFGRSEGGEQVIEAIESGPVNHYVEIATIQSFFVDYLNYDPAFEPQVLDWLTFPEQRLRTIAGGRVFFDGLGQLETIRSRLSYYPRDLWLYLLASQWRQIAQLEAFMGRCGDVGDELGSQLVAASLVRHVMKLCFLMERQYAPYSKWFGTAFAQLGCAGRLAPILAGALEAGDWKERERFLSAAYEQVAQIHNVLQLTPPQPARVSNFHSRPSLVIHADNFVEALREAIASSQVRGLPAHLGAVDQFVDSADLLEYPDRLSRLKVMYHAEPD